MDWSPPGWCVNFTVKPAAVWPENHGFKKNKNRHTYWQRISIILCLFWPLPVVCPTQSQISCCLAGQTIQGALCLLEIGRYATLPWFFFSFSWEQLWRKLLLVTHLVLQVELDHVLRYVRLHKIICRHFLHKMKLRNTARNRWENSVRNIWLVYTKQLWLQYWANQQLRCNGSRVSDCGILISPLLCELLHLNPLWQLTERLPGCHWDKLNKGSV